MIMAVTAKTESNDIENVLWVIGRLPMFTFDMNMKSCIFAHFGVISLLYLFVYMYISYKAHNRFYKGNLIDSVRRRWVHVSCTEEYTLLHYGHESEKLHFEPSQNATVTNCDDSGILAVAFCDLSHFVINAVTAQTESNNTVKTCSGYLGEYPCSLLTWIWKVAFLHIWRYFTVISVYLYVYQL